MSLQGTLRTLGITEVLEFLADRTSTGRLDISAGAGSAVYWLFRGEVASCEYSFEREDGTDAAEATYYALAELDGSFMFDEEQVPQLGVPTEEVGVVLGRTAEIAEAWSEVEEVIPTTQHWLHRNEVLDSSVTIEPEWWKAIDVIGSGCSAAHLASALGEGALHGSTLAMNMANAGLVLVESRDGGSVVDEVVDEALDSVELPDEVEEVQDVPDEVEEILDDLQDVAEDVEETLEEVPDEVQDIPEEAVEQLERLLESDEDAAVEEPDFGQIGEEVVRGIEDSWDAAIAADSVEPGDIIEAAVDDGWASDHSAQVAPTGNFAPLPEPVETPADQNEFMLTNDAGSEQESEKTSFEVLASFENVGDSAVDHFANLDAPDLPETAANAATVGVEAPIGLTFSEMPEPGESAAAEAVESKVEAAEDETFDSDERTSVLKFLRRD